MFEKSRKIEILRKIQIKSNKSLRIRIFHNGYLGFSQKWPFYPQSKKLIFFYITFYMIQNFQIFQRTVQYVVEPCLGIWYAKFQVDISVFGKHIYNPKTVSVDDVIFQIVILNISGNRTEIKMTFLES